MDKPNSDKWVLVSDGTPQLLYLGKTPLDDSGISDRLSSFIFLGECRCLRTILVPGPQGVAQQNILTSNSIARAGILMRIRPVSWWWPEEDEDAMEVVQKMIEHAEVEELRHRVEKAGIVVTGSMPDEGHPHRRERR